MNVPDPQSRPALAPRVRLRADPVTGEPVLLYPEGILILNPTAHEIVTRCDGEITVDGLIRLLYDEYEESEETLRHDVLETLADLKQRNLIVLAP
jgi:pyrroloquinoline quinone biosynthesis protein D